jgi:hemoglobin
MSQRFIRHSAALHTAVFVLLAPTVYAQMPHTRASDQAPPLEQIEAPVPGSLYVRMGGARNIQAIVGDFIDRSSRDPRTRQAWDKVNLPRAKSLLALEICDLTGGGCKYTGDNVHDVHAGLGITEAQFFGVVEMLRDTMRQHGVRLRERNELLQILAPMKRDIVER